MKNFLLIISILVCAVCNAQTKQELDSVAKANNVDKMRFVMNRSALQNLAFFHNSMVFMLSDQSMTDSRGGTYYYDSASAASIDTVYLNFLAPNSRKLTTGRWIKLIQREVSFPGGLMTYNGTTRQYVTSGVTDANGQITLKLTTDTSATGPALFNSIKIAVPIPDVAATGPQTAVSFYQKVLMSNATFLKTPSYGFYRPNPVAITLSALAGDFFSVTSVGPGVKVNFLFIGN